MALSRSSCVLVSARSSPSVSNSLAIWAKSSSRPGTSLALTLCTVTVTSASWPARSPPASSEENVFESPADMPISASSRPSSRDSLPTGYDSPLACASSTGLPSTEADRSIET